MAKNEPVKTSGNLPTRPVDIFASMRNEMDRMFERFETGWPRWPVTFGRNSDGFGMVPDLDVRDSGKQITIEADLPGVDEKDVTVTLANGVLTIKGEKKADREERHHNYYVSERSYGSFERSVRLPDTIDEAKVEARFDKGVLKVVADKKPEALTAEKKIEIKKSS